MRELDASAVRTPFEEVYRTQVDRVYAFCLSQVRNAADAEDLTAEVFASAFAAWNRAAPEPDRVQAWLIGIARNASIDHYRRGRRRAVLASVLGRTAEQERLPDVESGVVLRDELAQVLHQAGQLRPRDRLLIGLRVAADLSYAEIAEVAQLTEHAATVATRRALARLRGRCEGAS
jgi:RNA polymerase sigma-70 factor (ECF subfamily)